jgi:hypothetical protein
MERRGMGRETVRIGEGVDRRGDRRRDERTDRNNQNPSCL